MSFILSTSQYGPLLILLTFYRQQQSGNWSSPCHTQGSKTKEQDWGDLLFFSPFTKLLLRSHKESNIESLNTWGSTWPSLACVRACTVLRYLSLLPQVPASALLSNWSLHNYCLVRQSKLHLTNHFFSSNSSLKRLMTSLPKQYDRHKVRTCG